MHTLCRRVTGASSSLLFAPHVVVAAIIYLASISYITHQTCSPPCYCASHDANTNEWRARTQHNLLSKWYKICWRCTVVVAPQIITFARVDDDGRWCVCDECRVSSGFCARHILLLVRASGSLCCLLRDAIRSPTTPSTELNSRTWNAIRESDLAQFALALSVCLIVCLVGQQQQTPKLYPTESTQ